MKKVLFVTNHYIDQNFGGPNATKSFIYAFSSIYKNITLVCPDYEGSSISNYVPQGVRCIPCYDRRSLFKKVRDVYRGKVTRYTEFLEQHLRSNQYDVIVIDHSKIWADNTDCLCASKATIVTIHHNVEKNYLRDNPINILIRFPYNHYSLKAEKDAIYCSDLNLTLTENDKRDLISAYPNIKGRFGYIGAFEYQSFSFGANDICDLKTFIITGNLSFKQTSTPVMVFLKKYLPVLEKLVPDVKVIIAGRNPNNAVINECKKHRSIELIANPNDMLPLLQRSSLYICPTDKGSGQKLRISDGLKCGLPVICHINSLSGYEKMQEQSYVITYNDTESFKEAVLIALGNMNKRVDIANAYNNFYSFEAGTNRLRSILYNESLL